MDSRDSSRSIRFKSSTAGNSQRCLLFRASPPTNLLTELSVSELPLLKRSFTFHFCRTDRELEPDTNPRQGVRNIRPHQLPVRKRHRKFEDHQQGAEEVLLRNEAHRQHLAAPAGSAVCRRSDRFRCQQGGETNRGEERQARLLLQVQLQGTIQSLLSAGE